MNAPGTDGATTAGESKNESPGRYFPGWTMLGIAGLAQFLSAPGQSYSVAAVKDPMRIDLGLSETQYSLAYAVATVVSAVLLPFTGRLTDRFGARIILPLLGIGLGAACFAMSQVTSLPQLYCCFMVVRSLGQGALILVAGWLIGEWFCRRRGMATAIAGLGGGLSVMTIPLLNNWFVENYDWQTAWIALSVLVAGLLVIPAAVFVRDRPEDIGLHPDGLEPMSAPPDDDPESKTDGTAEGPTSENWTVADVIRNPTFWKLLSVPATSGMVGTGLVFHQVALLGTHGVSRGWALGMMTLQAGFATLLTFPAGWATDRWPNRFLLLTAMCSLALAVTLLLTLPSVWFVFVYALLLGLHGSILRSTGNVVWINYYGRANQGAVRGVSYAVMILAAAVGPLPLAFSIDQWGSYRPALLLFLSAPIFAGLAVSSARQPRKG